MLNHWIVRNVGSVSCLRHWVVNLAEYSGKVDEVGAATRTLLHIHSLFVGEGSREGVLNLWLQRVFALADQFAKDGLAVESRIICKNGEETRVFEGGEDGGRQGQSLDLISQFALDGTSEHLLVNSCVDRQLLSGVINVVGEILDQRLELDEVIHARICGRNLRYGLEGHREVVDRLEASLLRKQTCAAEDHRNGRLANQQRIVG